MNLLEKNIGALARRISGATGIFHRYGLDFCCKGAKPLGILLTEKNIDPVLILSELQKLIDRKQTSSSYDTMPISKLISHITERYHTVHREQLPELIRLSSRVENVHKDHSQCPTGLSEHLKILYSELESHMNKEEEIVFPLILKKKNDSETFLGELQDEHESQGTMLEVIERLTGNMTLPKGACNTWQALYKGLEELKIDLMEHIHIENNILFDRLREEEIHTCHS